MEPFHQLSCPCTAILDLESAIRSLSVSTETLDDPILVRKHDGFSLLICERDGVRFIADIGPCPDDPSVTWLVYVNTPNRSLQSEIRAHLESLGATLNYH